MSRRCSQCERKPLSAQNRSHSMQATKRRMYLNLQPRMVNGKRVMLCTTCLKAPTSIKN